ncbi:MAG: EAL domain-containing protein [Candidatus Acidiferrales bacterium]|jgi:diguanylate cyclase (GGDEF)-like protein/PAS domain S-box-containing protein
MNNSVSLNSPPSNRKVHLAFGPIILAFLFLTILVVGAVSYRGMVTSRESDRWVRHTYEVLLNLQDLLSAMNNAESSYRGFVISGDERSLTAYGESILRFDHDETFIRDLTAGNPVQQRQITTLERLTHQKIQFAETVIALRRAKGIAAAADAVRERQGQRIMDEFQRVLREMQDEELGLLALRSADLQRRLAQSKAVLIFGVGLSLLLATAASWSVQRASSRRGVAEDALFLEKERAQVTLNSIGDAVICTDISGNITFLNLIAEKMTAWKWKEAVGRPITEVFPIIDGDTRRPAQDPMELAIAQNRAVALTANCVLLRRDGSESAIEDSAAPIHDSSGRVIGAVIVFHDVSATRAMSLQMAYSAQHDLVTNLPNRLLVNDRIAQSISLARRQNRSIAVLFLDLDHFKYINDSLGHAVGDQLLQSVSKRLLASVRGSDTVSRQGGDEFVILLSEIAHPEDAATSAHKILLSLSAPCSIAGHDLHIDGSIGISIYPADGVDAETLIKNADTAMYNAKEHGRNNFQFFTGEMNLKSVHRQSVESSLRRAIERDEFLLYYQPKVNLLTGEITGVEALIRWQQPDRGLVPPAQFVSIAEDCGLIVPIGRWVLRQACRQARKWQAAGLPFKRISVNVSAAEFRDKSFVENVATILAETDLDARYLDLELTEGVLMADAESTGAILRTLKTMGIQLAVDDFGTGYSSLSYLRQFPIDVLKIDQSFVQRITDDPDDSAIVRAIIDMGKNLKLRVIAEGIETKKQLAFLQAQHCAEGQGYLFSLPLGAAQFAHVLRSGVKETGVS